MGTTFSITDEAIYGLMNERTYDLASEHVLRQLHDVAPHQTHAIVLRRGDVPMVVETWAEGINPATDGYTLDIYGAE